MNTNTLDTSKDLVRYKDLTRMNHWAIVLLFFGAGLSGLAFLHPSLFFFTNLFGGWSMDQDLAPLHGAFDGFVLCGDVC